MQGVSTWHLEEKEEQWGAGREKQDGISVKDKSFTYFSFSPLKSFLILQRIVFFMYFQKMKSLICG